MTEKKEKATPKAPKTNTSKGKTTQSKVKTEEIKVDDNQISLLDQGKTVGDLKAEDILMKPRTSVKTETKDFTLDEIRTAVKLVNEGVTRVSVVYDLRNYEGIQSVIGATGIKKEVIYDIAIKRFLDWQDKKTSNFPFSSVKDVTPTGTRTTIVISKVTKERLDKFCDDNLQQVNLIVNLALQGLIEEVKAFNK